MLERSQWEGWAREWGLKYSPQRGGLARNEWMVGAHGGYLLKIGWMGNHGSTLYILLRFPKQSDPARLRGRMLQDPALISALPRWGKRATLLKVDERALLWTYPILWKSPAPEKVRRWVEQLIQTLTTLVTPFNGKCEQCQGSGVNQYVLCDEIPSYLCAACQERLTAEGSMAERKYTQQEANYPLGTLYGFAAAAAGGVGWALLAILTNRIYAAMAIALAWMVAWAYFRGSGKIDRAGQFIGAVLTIAGVIFGKILYYSYMIHKHNPNIPFRLDVGGVVFLKFLKERPGRIVISLLFGLLGVWYVFKFLQAPRLKSKIEKIA